MVDFSPLRYLANDPNQPYDPLGAINPFTTGLANLAARGFMAPGRALASTTPITSEQMIAPAQDMMALMGTGAPMAQRGAVGAFGGRLAPAIRSDLPESITGAAVRYRGNIYTGRNHLDAVEAAAKANNIPFKTTLDRNTALEAMEDTEGFATSHGRYVDRQTAGEIADRMNQLRKTITEPLSAQDLIRPQGFGK
jgi:hypothetical protein